MKKTCLQCGAEFSKRRKYSAKQWAACRFCSNECSGRFNLARSNGGWNKSRHLMSGTPTYKIWLGMRNRCESQSHKHFDRYGGRGISVCARWQVFENFLADMGERPAGLTIERKDNDKGYEPGNCVWATRKQQSANTRHAYRIPLGGRVLPLGDAARELGVPMGRLRSRIKALGVIEAVAQLVSEKRNVENSALLEVWTG